MNIHVAFFFSLLRFILVGFYGLSLDGFSKACLSLFGQISQSDARYTGEAGGKTFFQTQFQRLIWSRLAAYFMRNDVA